MLPNITVVWTCSLYGKADILDYEIDYSDTQQSCIFVVLPAYVLVHKMNNSIHIGGKMHKDDKGMMKVKWCEIEHLCGLPHPQNSVVTPNKHQSKIVPSILPLAGTVNAILLKEVMLELTQFNSLWPSDTIWQHRSGSTLGQVIMISLIHFNSGNIFLPDDTKPITWTNGDLSSKGVLYHSPESNFTKNANERNP